MSLRIFPATDLHLLNGTSVLLRFFASTAKGWNDVSDVSGIQLNPIPAFAVQLATPAGLSIKATDVGSAVTRVVLPGANVSVPIRLSVHRELRRLFLPRNALILETDRDDRVLTVYGEFKAADGSMVTEDITAHPYLRYSVKVTGGSPTVVVNPAGRITSGNAAGTVEIEVSVDRALSQPAPAVTMSVTIVAAVTDRPILTRFHTGTAIRKKSILFLPDGFTSAQQAEFERLASDVGRKLLRAISPYRHLRESFDLYSAFVPSAEEGTTVGPPIITRPGAANIGFSLPMDRPIQQDAVRLTDLLFHLGHPATSAATTLAAARTQLAASMGINVTAQELPQNLYDLWQSLRKWPPQSRVRETFFGIMIDDRHHGTAAIVERVPTLPRPNWPPLDAAIYLSRAQVRQPLFDERRLPDLTKTDPKTAHLPALSRFVKTLRVPGEAAGLGAIWAAADGGTPAGDSFNLVVIIARSDQQGGARAPGCLLVSTGAGMIHSIQASTVIPRVLEVAPVPRPISAAHRKLGFQEMPLDALMDTVAHELAHSDSLGKLNDEYGDQYGSADPAKPEVITFVEDTPNTQLIDNVRAGAGPGLNVMQIKWNLERVDGAARVETIRAAGAEIEIGLTLEDALRWPTLAAGRLLTLRSGNLAAPAPGSKHVGTTPANPIPQPLNLVSFDLLATTIRCTVLGPAAPVQVVTTFPPGSVILVPRLFAGATVRVIPAALDARLAATGPFSPSGANCRPVAKPAAPNVARFAWPRNQLQAVAAYEVGAGFDCGVIRPTGECKMRTIAPPTEFCYICKYAMVYAIDPTLLAAIDSEYP